jgi:hypothetical protein
MEAKMNQENILTTAGKEANEVQFHLQIEVLEMNVDLRAAAGACTSTSTSCSSIVDN